METAVVLNSGYSLDTGEWKRQGGNSGPGRTSRDLQSDGRQCRPCSCCAARSQTDLAAELGLAADEAGPEGGPARRPLPRCVWLGVLCGPGEDDIV